MTLWQRIKSWFGFKPKQVAPVVKDNQADHPGAWRTQRELPTRAFGESEARPIYGSARVQPTYTRPATVSRQAVSTPVTDRGMDLLDTVTTVLAVDAVTDMVSSLLKDDTPASPVGWGDHEARVASENAYATAREEAIRPSEPVSSTRFDDTSSSSFSGSSSNSYDDSYSRSSSSSSSSNWGGDSGSSSSSSSWGDSGSSSWSD